MAFALLTLSLPLQSADARAPKRGGEHIAGQFDYYALVLSWSPTFCEGSQGSRNASQCDVRRRARPYAFVLHGLWPQYERRWPEFCRTRERPFVPRKTIDSMMDIMPSRRLIIHEYKKHGTCTGYDPQRYYLIARKFYEFIKIPDRYKRLDKPLVVTQDELRRDLLAVNPGLRAKHLSFVCRGSGNRLREIRICFTRTGKLRACGANENQRRLCRSRKMFMPPVRFGR
ncbi:MAG: ribonuclease T2 [Pseudomonadota bacterium]